MLFIGASVLQPAAEIQIPGKLSCQTNHCPSVSIRTVYYPVESTFTDSKGRLQKEESFDFITFK